MDFQKAGCDLDFGISLTEDITAGKLAVFVPVEVAPSQIIDLSDSIANEETANILFNMNSLCRNKTKGLHELDGAKDQDSRDICSLNYGVRTIFWTA